MTWVCARHGISCRSYVTGITEELNTGKTKIEDLDDKAKTLVKWVEDKCVFCGELIKKSDEKYITSDDKVSHRECYLKEEEESLTR